jgi:hypothetical protein
MGVKSLSAFKVLSNNARVEFFKGALEMAFVSCSKKGFFSIEFGYTNLYESLYFVVYNSFLNVKMDSVC